MSYIIVYDVFVTVLGLRGVDLLVFATIYNAVAHLHGDISLSQITKRSGVCHSSVCRILKEFEDKGWISKLPIGRRGKNHYEIYVVKVGHRGIPIASQGDTSSPNLTHVEKNTLDKSYTSGETGNSIHQLLPYTNNL